MAKAVVPSSAMAVAPPSALVVPPNKTVRLVSYDVLDCTFGSGYHTGAVLENGRPYTRVVAMDSDPEVTVMARELLEEFGDDRLRLYCNRMSEMKAMFGERSFDAVVIDPGPSVSQAEDPERGFLLFDESEHAMDMRYSCTSGIGALEYLNTVPQHTLASALRSYGILTPEQSMKMARAIRKGRPFTSSRKVLQVVEDTGDDLPEEGWQAQDSRRKAPMSWKFLTSLRCIINREHYELSEALRHAFLVLRDNGRLVVFTRLPWEEELVKQTVEAHPYALLCYSEKIGVENVQEFGHVRHTIMWVLTKTAESAFVMKNTQSLTGDAVKESSTRWMNGMFAGQTHGFPAHNFTFENMDAKERRVARRNVQTPDFDYDDDDRR